MSAAAAEPRPDVSGLLLRAGQRELLKLKLPFEFGLVLGIVVLASRKDTAVKLFEKANPVPKVEQQASIFDLLA